MDIIGLYEDFLLDASYAGIPFTMVDSRDEPGRRVLRFLFPGQDVASFQDLGVLDGEIRVTGFLIGDDYIDQAQALRQAFRAPGPATLVHPWLGQLQVVLGEQKPVISFTQHERRVARFEASFWPYEARAPQPADTLAALLDQADSTEAAVSAALAAVLGPVAQTLALFAGAELFCLNVQGVWQGLVNGSPADAAIIQGAGAPVSALGTAGTLTPGAGYAAALTALLTAPSAAIAQASNPIVPAAIGPGDSAVVPAASDPTVTTGLLLQALPLIGACAPAAAIGPVLAVCGQAFVVIDAVRAASDIPFTSDVDARTWLATILAAIDAVCAAAVALASASPATVGQIWSGLTTLRSCIAADIGAAIGRLPVVTALTLPTTMPAWLIAQYLAGDDPTTVLATWQDIVARNHVLHPALVPGGTIEVLMPA